MLQGLLGGDAVQRIRRQVAQRAAGGGEDDAADLLVLFAPEALPDGAVFGVHRAELAATTVGRGAHESAGHDDDLLVGEGDSAATLQGDQGWLEPGAAGGADDEHVDVRVGGHLLHWRDLGAHLAGDRGEAVPRAVAVGSGANETRAKLARLLGEELKIAAGGKRFDPEAVGEGADDVQRLGADASSAAEQREAD